MGVHIQQIIMSCNEDETYSSFWQPVAWAYKRMFPDVKIHLAFLTNRDENDPLVLEFRRWGTVTLFKPVPDVQEFAQAKMIRFILASMQGNDVCYIDDIDLFPLDAKFITDKVNARPTGKLLCVGGEVYNNNGCYPVSQMTAEGHVWKKFINPQNLDYPELIRSYRGKPMFDKREDIDCELDFSKDSYFSDERLIRRLRTNNPVPVFEMKRGYRDYLEVTLDRAAWSVNEAKLMSGGYLNAHGIRPYSKHIEEYKPLIRYIANKFPEA